MFHALIARSATGSWVRKSVREIASNGYACLPWQKKRLGDAIKWRLRSTMALDFFTCIGEPAIFITRSPRTLGNKW